ncbi:MAG TPA: PIN domain-containing protein [Thermoanaerobaculia bacterium]|nr:PIN domain-containing protein [Thermoanaerobaculia bacterium]
MADYVLDTSALLTLLKDEDGAEEVEAILEACDAGRSRAYLPFMSVTELEYLLLRSRGRAAVEQVLRILQAWPVERIESNLVWGRKAAAVKAQGGLSMADAWISSLALILDAELVHKDPELDALQGLKHRRLPYKRS